MLIEISSSKDVINMMLYLLRQQTNQISRSLLDETDLNIEVVSIEPITSMTPSLYDDLIEKIFSSERVIVI